MLRDPVLSRVLWAVRAINRVFAVLYQGGLWLTQDEAQEAGKLGRHWLRALCGSGSYLIGGGKLRFPIVVKHHMLDHHFRDLLAGSQHVWTWNCLADSVQMDEDFIGHTARLSRRVSPVSTAFRVIQRYLTRAMKNLAQQGCSLVLGDGADEKEKEQDRVPQIITGNPGISFRRVLLVEQDGVGQGKSSHDIHHGWKTKLPKLHPSNRIWAYLGTTRNSQKKWQKPYGQKILAIWFSR